MTMSMTRSEHDYIFAITGQKLAYFIICSMALEWTKLKFDKQVMLLDIVFHVFGAENKKQLSNDFFDF